MFVALYEVNNTTIIKIYFTTVDIENGDKKKTFSNKHIIHIIFFINANNNT